MSAYLAAICIVLFRFAAIVTGIVLWFIVVFWNFAPFTLKYFPSKLTLGCLFHNKWRCEHLPQVLILFVHYLGNLYHMDATIVSFVAPAPVLNSNFPLETSCNVIACFAKRKVFLY